MYTSSTCTMTAPLVSMLLFTVCLLNGLGESTDPEKLLRTKQLAYKQHLEQREQAWTQCATNPQSPQQQGDFGFFPGRGPSIPGGSRRRRAALDSGDLGAEDMALLLSSTRGTLVRENGLSDSVLPRLAFTVDLWWKPEGGQTNPAYLLEAEDFCSPFPQKGWAVGIETSVKTGEKDARIFFSLQTSRSRQSTRIFSPTSYIPGEWSHLAVSYDQHWMKMFVNGAQVAASSDQKGEAFGKADSDACHTLHLGGHEGHYYRGTIDNLRVWERALSQSEVAKAMEDRSPQNSLPTASSYVLLDTFDTLDQWEWTNSNKADHPGLLPVLVVSDIPRHPYQPILRPPPCGFTICDVPEVVHSYRDNWELRRPAIIRYRVLNVFNSDGSEPTVTEEQIQAQQRALDIAFAPYNISWQLHREDVFNTSLRSKTIVLGCNPAKIGNGQCNPECQFAATGNDGGDCDLEERDCDPALLNNSRCDVQCNTGFHDWDGGDCCSGPLVKTCFDPTSPHRGYLEVSEYKKILNFNNSKYINVLFAHWTIKNILGVAMSPWDKDVYTEQGGTVVDPNEFGLEGHMHTLVHEMGHALGLWHTHRGITEEGCNTRCFEKEASMTEGDLCDDTSPTPSNGYCRDPSPDLGICGVTRFENTPFRNYMGYADDSCTDRFTAQQVARMHCYLDLKYSTAQDVVTEELPPPPIPPKILTSQDSSLTITWTPPLSIVGFHDDADCSLCTENRELIQYAKESYILYPTNGEYGEPWLPYQAKGPPDAQTCGPSYKSWIPDDFQCSEDGCTLVLTFGVPVIPALVSVWIPWNSLHGLKYVELVFTDGTRDIINGFQAYCDMPLTLPVFYQKTLDKILLKANNSFVSVDAVQVVSTPNHPACAPCKPLRYRVFRHPPFTTGTSREAEGTEFTDREVLLTKKYKYRVQAWLGTHASVLSPPLVHRHGDAFCGDSRIDKKEECDDGNFRDGDGCSSKCTVENFFHCRGKPSICYWYIGDGICEDFERETSVQDCGHFTPDGFSDQWASSVATLPELSLDSTCSPELVVGPPSQSQVSCIGSSIGPSTSVFPCDNDISDDYWLAAWFPHPVVATSVHLYLVSNGWSAASPYTTTIGHTATVWLLDPTGGQRLLTTVTLGCSINPLVVGVTHDLSKPFFLTAGVNISFSSIEFGIRAVRLRSSDSLNPVGVSECRNKELYSPSLQKCVSYSCKIPTCSAPMSKHSTLKCEGFQEGDSCRVACNEGHWRVTNGDVVTCSDGKWVGADIHCKPVDCGPPIIAHADAFCPDGMTFGKVCTFKCRPPARLKGGATSTGSVTCEVDGQWSTPDAQCQLTCAIPSAPSHSVLDSQQCRQTDSLPFGHRCRFRCKAGFHVEGFSIRKTTLYLQCDSTGSWSGPSCVPVTCPPPPFTLNGFYNCTNGFHAGSVCTVYCNGEKEVSSSRCELDGTWSQPFIPCFLSGKSCPEPISPDANIKFLCDSHGIGSTCKVSCSQFGSEVVQNGIPMDSKKILCTGQEKWSPEPETFSCKEKCIHAYVGDGYCDAVNNQEWCGWDGGDCCASTVRDHTVKPFPFNCEEACQCQDPSAVENRVESENNGSR